MTVQADKCPMCPVQPQQRGVASNRKLGSIHSGAVPRLHPPDKSCSQASSMASIPLPTARRRVPTSCSSGGGTRAGPSTCQTNTSRGSSGSSTVSQCSRTKPVSPGSSTFNTGHSTCQTIAFVRGRELHQAGGEGGVEDPLFSPGGSMIRSDHITCHTGPSPGGSKTSTGRWRRWRSSTQCGVSPWSSTPDHQLRPRLKLSSFT